MMSDTDRTNVGELLRKVADALIDGRLNATECEFNLENRVEELKPMNNERQFAADGIKTITFSLIECRGSLQ